MIDVDRKQLEEALLSRSGHRIGGVVRIRPRVCAIRKPAVGEVVDYPLVRVLFRAHEHKAARVSTSYFVSMRQNSLLKGMWATGIVKNFQKEVSIDADRTGL